MSTVCPTVTAYDTHAYRQQMEAIEAFAKRVHIDLMDGVLAPTKSPSLNQIWLPKNIISDIHLMYKYPMNYLGQLVELKPNLVVIHQEAELDHADFAAKLHEQGIKAGLALMSDASVESASEALKNYDHVLVFSGRLGYHGGEADMGLLDKVRQLRQAFPQIEISWDGGINDQNARQLVQAGVDVLNTGGFIQKADNPQKAYEMIVNSLA